MYVNVMMYYIIYVYITLLECTSTKIALVALYKKTVHTSHWYLKVKHTHTKLDSNHQCSYQLHFINLDH